MHGLVAWPAICGYPNHTQIIPDVINQCCCYSDASECWYIPGMVGPWQLSWYIFLESSEWLPSTGDIGLHILWFQLFLTNACLSHLTQADVFGFCLHMHATWNGLKDILLWKCCPPHSSFLCATATRSLFLGSPSAPRVQSTCQSLQQPLGLFCFALSLAKRVQFGQSCQFGLTYVVGPVWIAIKITCSCISIDLNKWTPSCS